MTATRKFYDLFVIGAGSGGVRTARMAAATGAKVGLCELPLAWVSDASHGGVGGTCVLRGCVPKKLMVYASEMNKQAATARAYGHDMKTDGFDWTHYMRIKTVELERLNSIYKRILKEVDVVEGRGRLVGESTVAVTKPDGSVEQIDAGRIVIAVGGRPWCPTFEGSDLCINSDHALALELKPKKIMVFGSGFVGCEMACIFNAFGVDTHLGFRSKLPLPGFDEECREYALAQMRASGITLHTETAPAKVAREADGTLSYTATGAGAFEECGFDQVLAASGREPNTSDIGLEAGGVKASRDGFVEVVEGGLESVSNPKVLAVGDCIDRPHRLTPTALYEGMWLVDKYFKGEERPLEYDAVPVATFTQPPVAYCGETEAQATARLGADGIDVYVSNFKPMKYTLVPDASTRGIQKIVVERASQRVLGLHMGGPDAAEIMQGFALAVKHGLTKPQLDAVIGIHPTSAEEFVTMRSKRE